MINYAVKLICSGKSVYYTVHNCHILLLCYKRNKDSETNFNTLCLFVWLINMVLFPEFGKYKSILFFTIVCP